MVKRKYNRLRLSIKLGSNLQPWYKSKTREKSGKKNSNYLQRIAASNIKHLYGRIKIKSLLNRSNKVQSIASLAESRLDTIVFRLNWAPSIFAARQLINHGHIQVFSRSQENGSVNVNDLLQHKVEKLKIGPGYLIRKGDLIVVPLTSQNLISEYIKAVNSLIPQIPEILLSKEDENISDILINYKEKRNSSTLLNLKNLDRPWTRKKLATLGFFFKVPSYLEVNYKTFQAMVIKEPTMKTIIKNSSINYRNALRASHRYLRRQ